MEGLVIFIAVVVALVFAVRLVQGRKPEQKEPQHTEPPGERSAPDDWPRDGGNNPSAP